MSEDDIAMLAAIIRRAEGHIHRGQSLIDDVARLLMSHLPATIDEEDYGRDCHDFIGRNPALAYDRGWVLRRNANE